VGLTKKKRHYIMKIAKKLRHKTIKTKYKLKLQGNETDSTVQGGKLFSITTSKMYSL
jgi:hypothetical protein